MNALNGATSPSGEKHPGEIHYADHVAGREWTRAAAEVPQSIAWRDVGGVWHPVVKIVITGSTERREITSFGPHGEFLATTVQAPPPSAR